jgi:hypothetical protein
LKENKITQTNYYSLSTTRIQPSFNDNMSNNFTTAHDLLVDKFQLNFYYLKEKEDRVAIGDNLFIKPFSDLVCDTIVQSHLSIFIFLANSCHLNVSIKYVVLFI